MSEFHLQQLATIAVHEACPACLPTWQEQGYSVAYQKLTICAPRAPWISAAHLPSIFAWASARPASANRQTINIQAFNFMQIPLFR